MGAIIDFVAGPILGSTNDAKEWNDKVTNWNDTQALYQTGIQSVMQGTKNAENVQREMLGKALANTPEVNMKYYEPVKQQGLSDLSRQLRLMGRGSGSTAANAQGRYLSDFNLNAFKDAQNMTNAQNALMMNAGNQIANAYNTGGNSLASLYSNLGNLRYENSAGKHMLSMWGGN